LHSYWDGALDLYTASTSHLDNATFQKNVTELMNAYPQSMFTEELKETDPVKWAAEVYPIAVKYAYQNLYQSGGNYIVNQTYADLGRPQARRLIALAGYRLAQVLATFVKEKSSIFKEHQFGEVHREVESSSHAAVIWGINSGLLLIVVGVAVLVIKRRTLKVENDSIEEQLLTET
jgi:hypothetical protein